MAEVQNELGERGVGARLVSITVDPARDSAEALRAYAERYGADPDVWWFLTGERDALYELIGKGFLLSVAERSPEDAPTGDGHDLITHSDRFVLVDREGRIRGYYHGTERESVDALIDDLETLAAGG
jgi:protein SCO1/2